jgi:hypothetical protein
VVGFGTENYGVYIFLPLFFAGYIYSPSSLAISGFCDLSISFEEVNNNVSLLCNSAVGRHTSARQL